MQIHTMTKEYFEVLPKGLQHHNLRFSDIIPIIAALLTDHKPSYFCIPTILNK